jgi:hypothetical protein
LDFGSRPISATLSGIKAGRVLLSTALDREGEAVNGSVSLRADEGIIIEVDPI